MRKGTPLVIIDGDDTLWKTMELYMAAKSDIHALVEAAGLSKERWKELQSEENLRLTKTMHLNRAQFPLSCALAVNRLEEEAGRPHDESLANAVSSRAQRVFDEPVHASPETLSALASLGKRCTLVLLTKGDVAIQLQRVGEAGIGDFFTAIHVTSEEKSADLFAGLCRSYGVAPECAWSVGNSLPSDIAPAAAIGMKCVLVDTKTSWAYEARAADLPPHADIRHAADFADAAQEISTALSSPEPVLRRVRARMRHPFRHSRYPTPPLPEPDHARQASMINA